MAKKDYDVAKRFTEVARRAREIDTAPKKKSVLEQLRGPSQEEIGARNDYNTRPGKPQGSVKLHPNGSIRSEPYSFKDVNLPIDTGPSKRPPSGKHDMPTEDTYAYDTRPGNKYKGREYERYSKIGTPNEFKDNRDVNLPIETASPEVRKRLADSLRKKR